MTRSRAQSMVEFAIVVPVFLLLLLGLIDFSRLIFTYISLTNGARELSRTVTITSNSMSNVASAFNNLTIIGGTTSSASSVSIAAPSGGGSGTITCTGTTDALCSIQVTTGPSTSPSCASGNVCLTGITGTGSSGPVTYTSSTFNYSFNPTGNGDFVMLTWLALDGSGHQQGYIQVCRLPFSSSCIFPSGLNRSATTDGSIQVDVRYTFQFNPLFQNRLAGVVDVSFMNPSTLVTTSVRTYAE